MPGIDRELADEAAADTRFPPGWVRTIPRLPSPAERARIARDRLAASRAAAAREAAVGSLAGGPTVGTHHATVPRPADEPREGSRGPAIRPTPGISHAPVLRAVGPSASPAAAPRSTLPPSTWGLPNADGSRSAAFLPPLAFDEMDLDISAAPVFAQYPNPDPPPSPLTPTGLLILRGLILESLGLEGPTRGIRFRGKRSGGPDPTFDIFAFDEYQVPVGVHLLMRGLCSGR
jgi:hypothetical protein